MISFEELVSQCVESANTDFIIELVNKEVDINTIREFQADKIIALVDSIYLDIHDEIGKIIEVHNSHNGCVTIFPDDHMPSLLGFIGSVAVIPLTPIENNSVKQFNELYPSNQYQELGPKCLDPIII